MDTTMNDVGPLPKASTSNIDVYMAQATPPPAGIFRRNPDIINLQSDDGNESDGTLLGDEVVERAVPQVRRPVRTHAAFRELQTYTRGGRNVQVGRIIQGQDGNLLRVISIKQDWESGFITIESFEDNFETLQTYSYEGRTLKPGKTVEMTDREFLRIKVILNDRRSGEIFLKGLRFRRNSSLKGLLEFEVNEVTIIIKYDPNDTRTPTRSPSVAAAESQYATSAAVVLNDIRSSLGPEIADSQPLRAVPAIATPAPELGTGLSVGNEFRKD